MRADAALEGNAFASAAFCNHDRDPSHRWALSQPKVELCA
jgi:hypothetical protein